MIRRIRRFLLIPVALVFLFEAWLWEHLAPVVRWVVERVAWRRLRQTIAQFIASLPPYPTLLVFLVPVVLLFPLKLLGLWMLAQGSWFGAMTTLAFAKVVSVGVTAFIFDLTRPKLMQLAWFPVIYEYVLAWIVWAHAMVDPIKEEVRRHLRAFAPKRATRTWKLLRRIRRQRLDADQSA